MEKFAEQVIENPQAIKGGIIIADEVVFVNSVVILDDITF